MTSAFALSASTFNWTRDLMRAERAPREIVAAAADVSPVLELELGQLLRSFPGLDEAEIDDLAAPIVTRGGSVSIVGLSLDDWSSPTTRRAPAERVAFLEPQLRAARRLGAHGVRLPFGQPGAELTLSLLPLLNELDLILYQEIQGQQAPGSPGYDEVLATIDDANDPRLRVLLDASMLMPELPTSYLDALAESGVPRRVVDAVGSDWLDPATADLVRSTLAEGEVPPPDLALYITLIVRFGRSSVADLSELLPYVGGVHLKFWDLDDADGRVTQPIRDLAIALRDNDFTDTLCSEWGGHDWLTEADATAMTTDHLRLIREVLAEVDAADRTAASHGGAA